MVQIHLLGIFFINICSPLTVSSIVPCNGDISMPSAIFNLRNSTDCHALSRTATHPDDIKIIYLDANNETKGVSVTYTNGRWFVQNGEYLGSRTKIDIYCDQVNENPRFLSMTKESDKMVYSFAMKSRYACPVDTENPCVISYAGKTVDLRKMTRTDSPVTGVGTYDYMVNFCRPISVENFKQCEGAEGYPTVAYFWNDPKRCIPSSKSVNKADIKVEWISNENPNIGVKLFQLNGKLINNYPSRTIIEIRCSNDEEIPTIVSELVSDGFFTVNFKAASKFACLGQVVNKNIDFVRTK